MQYFIRTMERRKEGLRRGAVPLERRLYPELEFSALNGAVDEAKRTVLESDRAIMLQVEACSRNRGQVQTRYRCWIDERGTFNERALV